MKRRLFNLLAGAGLALTAVSLAFFVAFVALWIRQPFYFFPTFLPFQPRVTAQQSRARMDLYGNTGPEFQWFLGADHGQLILQKFHCGDPMLRNAAPKVWQRGALGFCFGAEFARSASGRYLLSSVRWYAVPIWAILLATAWLPALMARRLVLRARADLRRQRGECAACGYDLRATPQRCPECGTIPKKVELKQA